MKASKYPLNCSINENRKIKQKNKILISLTVMLVLAVRDTCFTDSSCC